MKHRRYYMNFMKDLVEVILQQTPLPKIFLMQDIGGPSYFMIF
jgi:hypothetical protein